MSREQRIHIIFAAPDTTGVLLINTQAHDNATLLISSCSGYEAVEKKWRKRGETCISMEKSLHIDL
jgi:hypothetical protein